VSAGTISSGQGTSSITVDTTDVPAGSTTATVSIGGFDRVCNNTTSETTGIKPRPQPARKFDEFVTLPMGDRNARLDNYAIELLSNPAETAYLIGYSGRKSLAGATAKSLLNMKAYLSVTRGIDRARIVTVDGGYREEAATELWIVPQRSAPPSFRHPTIHPRSNRRQERNRLQERSPDLPFKFDALLREFIMM
jgi:hypothetical protein